MEEVWRDVPGYEGKYQISISIKEGKCRRCFKHHIRVFDAKPSVKDGRIRWCLLSNGTSETQQAAVWIALTYPELVQNEWFEGAEIDHIDTDRLNNHPSNLRWVSRVGNNNNPITRKHNSESHKGKVLTNETKQKLSESHKGININNPSYSKWVIKLSQNNEILHFYPSAAQAERETGISAASIRKCCAGLLLKKGKYTYTQKNAGGYVWKYAE